MKKIISVILIFLSLSLSSFSLAKIDQDNPNNLRRCPSDSSSVKHNCFGLLKFEDGSSISAEFQNNRVNGYGTYDDGKGNKYYGQFNDGTPEGQGTMSYLNGDWYSGSIKNSKPDDYGTSVNTFSSGYGWSKYEGYFKEGKRTDGKEKVYYSGGITETAIVKNGEWNGVVLREDESGHQSQKLYENGRAVISYFSIFLVISSPILASMFSTYTILKKPFKNNLVLYLLGLLFFFILFYLSIVKLDGTDLLNIPRPELYVSKLFPIFLLFFFVTKILVFFITFLFKVIISTGAAIKRKE